MNIIIFQYNPNVIGITKSVLTNDCIIIAPASHQKVYSNLHLNAQIIFIEEYNEHNIFLEIKKLSKQYTIDKIIGLGEFDIELVGFLNQLYKTQTIPQLLSSTMFRDKYFMRIMLDGVINNPLFAKINNKEDIKKFCLNNNLSTCIIKPRKGTASAGVKIIRKLEDIDTVDFNLNDYICESLVNIQKTITADGIFVKNKIGRIYFHEYSGSLAESIEQQVAYNLVSTSYTIYSNPSLMDKLYLECEKVLSTLSQSDCEIFPFHMEWFLDENNNFIFCESGARFGGAEIPQLILFAHNENPLNLYWDLVLRDSKLTKQNNLQPQKIATTFMANRKEGVVKFIPQENEFSFTDQYRIIVKLDQKLESISNCAQNLFIAVISSNDLNENNTKIKQLELLQKQFIID